MTASRRIGLIIRGKHSADHEPGLLEQHADCILSNGEPYGFFGDNAPASGGGFSVSWNRSGMNMKGVAADYAVMKRIRPYYVDAEEAKRYDVKSTLLIIDASIEEAALFDNFWRQLRLKPGRFNILGSNCSSHASKAFITANIVSEGIPGLDTPNNLFKQLQAKPDRNIAIRSGHIGAKKLSENQYRAEIIAPEIVEPEKTW
ncbi:hypothetical protein EDC56_2837 [Sinobacterium caligoides]|uniref:DUF4105 domain-containing protein n=1 Tax=Sinobacterium caligoides TaxID=933926 RepID=A0A3N2DKI9_9GAMM|nr:hypothetical protein [Sinobacterium caligoides]ROS00199.1 hypothetical protein EDC56_2837 [Sinobacterium caligoides]